MVRSLKAIRGKKIEEIKKTDHIITFAPSPYIFKKTGNSDYETYHVSSRDLDRFAMWLYQTYGSEPVPAYRIARDLGMHRVCIDEWLRACTTLTGGLCVRGEFIVETHCMRTPFEWQLKRLRFTNLVPKVIKYDPWKDREWDSHFKNPWFPFYLDRFVDNYYDIFKDEVLICEGHRRRRENGHNFRRMVFGELDEIVHPLHFDKKMKELYYDKKTKRPVPPPKKRKNEISEACTGERPGIRKRTSAKTEEETLKVFKPWIKAKFFKRLRKSYERLFSFEPSHRPEKERKQLRQRPKATSAKKGGKSIRNRFV